jgi:FixJ family two-component response regulator
LIEVNTKARYLEMNRQAALKLGRSEKTVKVHREHIVEKMEAESLAHLVRMALPPPLPRV